MIKKLINISLIGALITQITHAAETFARISHDENIYIKILLSYIFAISLELAIYIFTMSGKRSTAIAFGLISILINIFYYWYPVSDIPKFPSSLIVSCIVPIMIYTYTDLIQNTNDYEPTEPKRGPGRPKKSID